MTDNAPATPEYIQLASACLALCAAHDPFFPKPEPLMTQAWARHLQRHRIAPADAQAAVYRMYDQNGNGFRPLPKDLIDAARTVRREADERTGPTDEYRRLCDLKAGDAPDMRALPPATAEARAEALAKAAAAIGQSHDVDTRATFSGARRPKHADSQETIAAKVARIRAAAPPAPIPADAEAEQ